MMTDHKFSPRNEEESTIVKAIGNATEILCRVLNVDVTLRVERMNGWARADAFHAGKWIPNRKMVKINMRNLYGVSLLMILEVLGHEFRHAVQTIHGKCDEVDDDKLLGGNRFKNSYWNSPREKDARKYQKAYATIIAIDEQFNYKDHLGNVLPGEPIRIPDREASLARLGIPKDFVKVFKVEERLYWFDLRSVEGNPKKWTKSVARTIWLKHKEQLLTQALEEVYREITIHDLVC